MQDIYVSILGPDGVFGPAVLVPGLNTASNDLRPNIRVRDGLEIFFNPTVPERWVIRIFTFPPKARHRLGPHLKISVCW